MASVNKVIIVGNLGRDPELRHLPTGDAVATMAVATSYRSKSRDTGETKESTEWHRISLFGRLAEIAGQFLKKGASVYIEGRLQTRKYTDKDGVEKYATDIIADTMQMLGGRNDSANTLENGETELQTQRTNVRTRDEPAPPPPAFNTAGGASPGRTSDAGWDETNPPPPPSRGDIRRGPPPVFSAVSEDDDIPF